MAERDQDMKDHVYQAHTLAKELAQTEVEKSKAETLRYEAETTRLKETGSGGDQGALETWGRGERKAPMERPKIDEGVTETDWSFFCAEWSRYEKATCISGESTVRHMWQACSEGLRRALHMDGADRETDPKLLLKRIKSLAVKRRNNLVNIMALQQMVQERDEGVLAFMARPICVTCPCRAPARRWCPSRRSSRSSRW